jgi:hypothetical protein
MSKKDLTPYATEGFSAPANSKCPHILSSPAEMAWMAGAWLNKTGRSIPRDVSMSRGYTLKINDMLLDVTNSKEISRIS